MPPKWRLRWGLPRRGSRWGRATRCRMRSRSMMAMPANRCSPRPPRPRRASRRRGAFWVHRRGGSTSVYKKTVSSAGPFIRPVVGQGAWGRRKNSRTLAAALSIRGHHVPWGHGPGSVTHSAPGTNGAWSPVCRNWRAPFRAPGVVPAAGSGCPACTRRDRARQRDRRIDLCRGTSVGCPLGWTGERRAARSDLSGQHHPRAFDSQRSRISALACRSRDCAVAASGTVDLGGPPGSPRSGYSGRSTVIGGNSTGTVFANSLDAASSSRSSATTASIAVAAAR